MQIHAKFAGRRQQIGRLCLGTGRTGWVDYASNGSNGRKKLMEQLQSLWSQPGIQLGYARNIAARPIEAVDEAEPNRVVARFEDDRTVVVAAFAASAAGVVVAAITLT